MTNEADDQVKRICADCVGESFLSRLIRATGTPSTCSYCGFRRRRSWEIDALADKVETAFQQHFERTSDQPDVYEEMLLRDKESSYNWYRSGEPIADAIESTAGVPGDAAKDIVEILAERHADWDRDLIGEETDFSDDSHYRERTDHGSMLRTMWFPFEHSIKTQARFFNSIASEYLSDVFKNLDSLRTQTGQRVIIKAGSDSSLKSLFRARVIFDQSSLESVLARPDHNLGPPPSRLATAGRMNARGVAAFYSATNPETAIAEVRPPVGSDVVVARFKVTRPLRILDLTRLERATATGSVFDPEFSNRLERVSFLQTLNHLMTRPVMPGDESLEYVTTQAVADYLATAYRPAIDGIAYRSAQVKVGKNVVLFNHAARVEELDLPEGTSIEVSFGHGSDEGWETDFDVTERIPPPVEVKAKETDPFILSFDDLPAPPVLPAAPPYIMDWDQRVPALAVDTETVVVHHIDWVRFGSSNEKVGRQRVVSKPDRAAIGNRPRGLHK
ncbi:RES domain-containing protein [Dyella sp. 333MFSha]|uniref:RES domain-containing protein n=1 Tax=Dyella sp. 333MFSha TaxID=1798240 RepID=UPI00087FE1E6|nr:RES domain-containing protein [Dyella sp. 333MFSha]SDG06454.1 RES domain-containing protein [Dyella sp. 333MFSha]